MKSSSFGNLCSAVMLPAVIAPTENKNNRVRIIFCSDRRLVAACGKLEVIGRATDAPAQRIALVVV